MCLGFLANYAGFMAVRALLGLTEGGLLPGIVSTESCSKLEQMLMLSKGVISVKYIHERRDGLKARPF